MALHARYTPPAVTVVTYLDVLFRAADAVDDPTGCPHERMLRETQLWYRFQSRSPIINPTNDDGAMRHFYEHGRRTRVMKILEQYDEVRPEFVNTLHALEMILFVLLYLNTDAGYSYYREPYEQTSPEHAADYDRRAGAMILAVKAFVAHGTDPDSILSAVVALSQMILFIWSGDPHDPSHADVI
jgi:hypothetical protein